jgi:hypothetical protein
VARTCGDDDDDKLQPTVRTYTIALAPEYAVIFSTRLFRATL